MKDNLIEIECKFMGWKETEVRFTCLPILEKCTKSICLCNLLQPNDWETVIEGFNEEGLR